MMHAQHAEALPKAINVIFAVMRQSDMTKSMSVAENTVCQSAPAAERPR